MKYLILQNHGFYSKHNMDCWNQEEYLGFGVNAHSYVDNVRYSNIDNIDEYMNGGPKIINERQDSISKMKEYMLLGLRKIEGVNIEVFKNKFNVDPLIMFEKEIKELQDLIKIDKHIFLTNKGLDFANIVWERFI